MPHRTIAEKDLPNDIGKNRHVFVLYSSNLVGRAFQSRGGDNYLPKDGEIYMNISSR